MYNVAHLAEYTYSSISSLTRINIYKTCNTAKKCKFNAVSINFDILLNKGLQNIQDVLNDTMTLKQTCIKCGNFYEIDEKYGPQVIIDTSVLIDNNYLKTIKKSNINNIYKLDKITKTIIINNNKYILRGVINYLKNMSHTIPHCYLQETLGTNTMI